MSLLGTYFDFIFANISFVYVCDAGENAAKTAQEL